jgi:hypothetical protein
MQKLCTQRLEGSPTITSLAPHAAGLVPAADRRSPGRQRKGCQTRAREEGPETLRHCPCPGAPCRLAVEQLARLPELLDRGAEAYGFRGQVWTRGRIAAVTRLEQTSPKLILLYSENKTERLAREPDAYESTLRAYPGRVAAVGGASGFPGQPDVQARGTSIKNDLGASHPVASVAHVHAWW